MELLSPARALLAACFTVIGVLALYGAHRLVRLVGWPGVTVRPPLYNEHFVAAPRQQPAGAAMPQVERPPCGARP